MLTPLPPSSKRIYGDLRLIFNLYLHLLSDAGQTSLL